MSKDKQLEQKLKLKDQSEYTQVLTNIKSQVQQFAQSKGYEITDVYTAMAQDILKDIEYVSTREHTNSDTSMEISGYKEGDSLIQSTNNQGFYTKDDDIVKNIVAPFINQTQEGFTIHTLKQFLSENANKVCTALFNEEKDTNQISQFIEKLYNQVEDQNEQQLNLYNDLYNLSNEVITKPKEADGRWITYNEAHINCEYMHLFALVTDNISTESVLAGQLNVQNEDIL